jgi:hypothetical protein
MFAIPLVGNRKLGIQPGMWLRLAACSGFTVTLLFVVLSVFPVIDVPNPASYAWKTVAVVVGVNTLGAILYTRRKKRSYLADPLRR